MKIKKGDNVVVITGKEKGKTGEVLEVYPNNDRVLVEGVNIVSRHTKPKSAQDQGGIIKKSAPIHVSNVMIFEDGKATRIAHKTIDGKKVRVSVKSGNSLDKAFVKAVKKAEKTKAKKKKVKTTPEKKEAAKPAAKPADKKVAEKKVTATKTTKKVAEKKTTVKTAAKSGK